MTRNIIIYVHEPTYVQNAACAPNRTLHNAHANWYKIKNTAL